MNRKMLLAIVVFIGVMVFSIGNFIAAKNGAGEGEGLVPPMCGAILAPISIIGLAIWFFSEKDSDDGSPPKMLK